MHERVRQALDESDVRHRVLAHADLPTTIKSPGDFSRATGIPLSRVTKTVLFWERSGKRRLVLVNAPIEAKVDLKKVANLLNRSALEVAPTHVLSMELDYPPTGVSPLGVSDRISVVIDQSILRLSSITIGGGRAGLELEIDPKDLQRAIREPLFADVTAP